MNVPEPQLLEFNELGTLAGAVSAVFFITNGLRHAFGLNPRVFGLVSSLAVSSAAVWLKGDLSAQQWLIAIPNAFIIYGCSVGVATMAGQDRPDDGRRLTGGRVEETEEPVRSFFATWF